MASIHGLDSQLMKKLNSFKAAPNWSEKTGPFFHLQLPGEVPMGPYHGVELKKFQDEYGLPEGTNVRDAKGIGEWQEIYHHQFFQRRKPQLLNSEEFPSEIESAYILIEGQKSGPFSGQELNELIGNQEILLTDQVSFDGGRVWLKLYEYEEFDRRDHTQNSLPESPGWDIFKESNTEIESELKNPTDAQQEEEAIAGLAFLENLKSGKTAKSFDKMTKDKESPSQELPPDIPVETGPPQTPEKGKGSTYAYAVAICFMLFGSFYFLTNKKTPIQVTTTSEVSEQIETTQTSNSKQKFDRKTNTYRSPRLKPKSNPRTRRPASITTTDSFGGDNRRHMKDSAYDNERDSYEDDYKDEYKEEYDYDQGETPVQQDPVRAKLDKQTIDSEKDYYDDQEQEKLEASYGSGFGEEAPEISPSEVWDARGPANAGDELPLDEVNYEEGDY
ncbi:MAG: hypothetical protein K9K67_13170 [Bacteriovoracaceae bacterium]|nr:hypothetical protein [Bacteriovoracaceae bacterium]